VAWAHPTFSHPLRHDGTRRDWALCFSVAVPPSCKGKPKSERAKATKWEEATSTGIELVVPTNKGSASRCEPKPRLYRTLLRSLPLAVADEEVALYEMQMLFSRLTPAIFISLGNAVARRCNLSGIFWFH